MFMYNDDNFIFSTLPRKCSFRRTSSKTLSLDLLTLGTFLGQRRSREQTWLGLTKFIRSLTIIGSYSLMRVLHSVSYLVGRRLQTMSRARAISSCSKWRKTSLAHERQYLFFVMQKQEIFQRFALLCFFATQRIFTRIQTPANSIQDTAGDFMFFPQQTTTRIFISLQHSRQNSVRSHTQANDVCLWQSNKRQVNICTQTTTYLQ